MELKKRPNEFIWTEAYRPNTLDECVLLPEVRSLLLNMVKGGEINNLLFVGPSGSGKTTAARAICEMMGADYLFINASKDNGIDVLRTTIQDFASSMTLSGGHKVVILDEGDFLNPTSTQPAFRAFIEEFSQTCRFIITCNFPNKILDALRSRLIEVDFSIPKQQRKKYATEAFARVCDILKAENITYSNEFVAEVIKKTFPDIRRAINILQAEVTKHGSDITESTFYDKSDFSALHAALKKKNFSELRAWVTNNSNLITHDIFTNLFAYFESEVKNPDALVILLVDYAYKMGFSADKELSLTACLSDIMISCEFT